MGYFMKISIRILSMLMVLVMLLPLSVVAGSSGVVENEAVTMPYASPVIDGTIEDDGKWSDVALFNEDTVGYFWSIRACNSYADMHFAYDDNGLYFAADINDSNSANGFIASTGYDNVDPSGSSYPYGFNGDVFTLMLDPLGLFEKSSNQTTAWYNVGIFADGTVKVYRSQVNEGDITSSVSAKGAITNTGWRFEAFIPWSIIIDDAADISGSAISPAQADLIKKNAVSRAAAMYMDRYTTAAGKTSTWGRFITVCTTTYDGTAGTSTSGVIAKAYGLELVNGDAPEHNWSAWDVETEATCTTAGFKSRTCSDCGKLEEVVVNALGHVWGDWVVDRPATATVAGKRSHTCKTCGVTESEEIPIFGQEPIIVVYYNAIVGASTYNFYNIDAVNYHPATLDKAYAASVTDPITHKASSLMSAFRNQAAKQNPDIKILFTRASNNLQVFESWLANNSTAEALADHIMAIVEKYGFDGVDIDYEFPSSANCRSSVFVHLMKTLRSRMNDLAKTTNKQYLISMAVPAGTWAFSLFDLESLQSYLDYFNIMNYDLYVGANNNMYAHHHAPPFDNNHSLYAGGSVASDIALYKSKGIAADKIVCGIGMYSRRWTNVSAGTSTTLPGLFQSGTLDDSNLYYEDLVKNYINKNGYVRYWDDTAKAPYLYNKTEKIFLTYDDPQSVEYKCNLVAGNGVRGVMMFDYVTFDGAQGTLLDDMEDWLKLADHTCTVVVTSTTVANCTDPGEVVYACSRCGKVDHVDTTPALGHTEAYDIIGTKLPTCTTGAMGKVYCSVCGVTIRNGIPKLGHDWGDWVVTTPATATTDGVETRTCKRDGCGKTETQSIPATGEEEDPAYPLPETFGLPGTWNDWYTDVTEMTEVSDGIWQYTFDELSAGIYEFNFTSYGAWDFKLGGVFTEFGVETDAYINSSDAINFTLPAAGSVTVTLDVTGYDPYTGTGAKFTVTYVEKIVEPYDGMVKVVGDYTYTYVENPILGAPAGWNAVATDKTQSSYGEILAELNGKPVTMLNRTFDGCVNMTEAPAIPAGVKVLYNTYKGTSIDTAPVIPEGVVTMYNTFKQCTALLEAPAIPSSVTDMTYCFIGCSSLTFAALPAGVTSIGTFKNSGVVNVTVNINVTSIGNNAFEGCDSLATVSFGGTDYDWYTLDKGVGNAALDKAELIFGAIESEPKVVLDGLHITVCGITDLKDYFIAPGTHETYRQVANARVLRVVHDTFNKWTLPAEGDYTLLVRHTDGTMEFVYFNAALEARNPTITEDSDEGFIITDLADVKVIRMAEGSYTTEREVKHAAGAVNFTQSAIKGAEEFIIATKYYDRDATYTFAIHYNDGRVVIKELYVREGNTGYVPV